MSRMVEVKAIDLVSPALDWAVGIVEGAKPLEGGRLQWTVGEFDIDHTPGMANNPLNLQNRGYGYCPSTEWREGGPLLDKYHVVFTEVSEVIVQASLNKWVFGSWSRSVLQIGPTRLIAACRAIVADKLGKTVMVPADLLEAAQ